MKYRVIVRKILGIRVYYPQEFRDGEWQDLEWGYDEPHTIWALSLKGAKRELREWKNDFEPNYEVVYQEEE